MNFGRKTMKAGVAAVAAIATLGAGVGRMGSGHES